VVGNEIKRGDLVIITNYHSVGSKMSVMKMHYFSLCHLDFVGGVEKTEVLPAKMMEQLEYLI
jgi:hypothetical protein